MEAAGLAVGVASLFATCIDCFELFRADLERERLLVWGELAGVCVEQVQEETLTTGEHQGQDLVKRCLLQIKRLLEDGMTLKEKYRLRPISSEEVGPPDHTLSSNAFKRLRLRLKRPTRGPGPLDKTMWAIQDENKFGTLVKDLQHFVNALLEKFPVSQLLKEQKIKDDIASLIDDIPRLSLIQQACQDDYSSWSKSAREAIVESERGTVNSSLNSDKVAHSALAWDNGATGVSQPHQTKNGVSSELTRLNKVAMFRSKTRVFFISTGPCQFGDANENCDPPSIGELVFSDTYSRSHLTFGTLNLKTSPGHRIAKYIRPQEHAQVNLDEYLDRQEEFRARANQLGKHLSEMKYRYRVQVYVYAGPCASQVRTALEICTAATDSPLVEYIARVDPRLNTCCSLNSSKIERLASIMSHVQNFEVDSDFHNETSMYYDREKTKIVRAIDREWLDGWVHEHECGTFPGDNSSPSEQLSLIASSHRNDETCAGIVILGEADYNAKLMEEASFNLLRSGQPVRDNEMWMMRCKYETMRGWEWTPQYLGKYSSYRAR